MDRSLIPLDHFIEKIIRIREELQEKRGTTNHAQVELLYSGSEFNHFKSVSWDELSDLVPRSTLKSCMLDPIPGSVLKNCYDLFLPFITKVVNCSLQNSTLTSDMKRAIVRPSLKKPSLDYQLYKNHRPISNLMFLSKCCEKVVNSFPICEKINLKRSSNPLIKWAIALNQHCCECITMCYVHWMMEGVSYWYCWTCRLRSTQWIYGILLSRLSQCIGVQGSAYTWFESYLSSRSQFVQIRDTSSSITGQNPDFKY